MKVEIKWDTDYLGHHFNFRLKKGDSEIEPIKLEDLIAFLTEPYDAGTFEVKKT